jgi:BirA family biotin operon repressor/biotin-[acetyl-CoA-carboxylase] ligase
MVESARRQQLVQLLLNDKGEYVSGQMISEQLGCSRTAIWKHINELRKDGYEVDAVPKKGYLIINQPDRISATEVLSQLETSRLGHRIHYEETVTSTQEIAHKLANDSDQEGVVVLAEEQLKGRGRLGRPWHSPKGSGIWMSLVLKPQIAPQKAPQLTLLAAVGVVQALHKVTGLQAEIKWPNDLLINGRKVVGILTELQAEADRVHSVIIGMGINVNLEQDQFPSELQSTATSISHEVGHTVTRAKLICAILYEIEKLYDSYLENGFHVIKLLWESYAASIGKRIHVRTLTDEFDGLALGISEEGVLLVEDDAGKVHRIFSADIHIPNN